MTVLRTHAWLRLRLITLCLGLSSGTGFAQAPLQVELDAPDSVRPLLERHLRILAPDGQVLPDVQADRIALARRTRREAAELLATEGYFTPEIRLQREPDGRWGLSVEPGPRASIAAVELLFDGDLAGDGEARAARRAALRRAWALAPGEPFRQSAWDDAKARLIDGVALRDYAAARIVGSRAEVDPDNATVQLSVTVDSGPRFFLGPLEVSGLQNLPPDFVERLNMLEPGEPFDQERLLALQTALQNSPQFASVIVDVERDPALAAAVPIRVQVTEAQSRYLGFGVGYSTNTGFRTEMSWRDVNLLDRGWELATGVRLEQRRNAAYADVFLPPARAGHRDSFGAAIERSTVEGLTLMTQALGVARTRTRGNIDTRLALRLQHEQRDPDGAPSTSRNSLTANWTWVRRRVDDLLDPRRGDVLQFDIGGGAKAALSDQDFLRLYGRYVRYLPFVERDVLILRVEGGATLGPSRDGVPHDFLFRTGGTQTVRGYAFESLGVREGDATVGGRYLAALSAEYVRWFLPQWGAAAFVDAGDAGDSRDAFALKTGYGVGARWKSPAGPLALDLAYGHDEKRLRLHFGIAIAF
ncbi:autotransporter assembly complex protein TamA [Azoarcus sp. PA01]|nr:autotransporter assembly complex protein TamA [Azoarcus sp. PA01]